MLKTKTKYTLNKEERLYAQKRIDALFNSGESFIAYPLRIVYTIREVNEQDDCCSISILTSVSKRKFKRAVKRNRVKRLIKEAYRLNKNNFCFSTLSTKQSLDIGFLFLKDELPEYAEIEKAMLKTAVVLSQKLQTKLGDETIS
ncbi:MAG: ribonuclease protein component [Bacteroidota bacterium]|jgi:ribonuclease P protein component